jgi:hypothetical protein
VVVPWSRFKKEYDDGLIELYGEQKEREFNYLHEIIIDFMSKAHIEWRFNRVFRDICSHYIEGGPKDVSMRDTLKREMDRRGLKCMDIRAREVKKAKIDPKTAKMFIKEYDASGGKEFFISFETEDRSTLFGFLRLRLSEMAGKAHVGKRIQVVFPELIDTAMIRELHVYGQTTEVKRESTLGGDKSYHQHQGFGTQMVLKAFEIAQSHGFKRISVISGEGVKPYYMRFGFSEEGHYMTHVFNIFTDSESEGSSGTDRGDSIILPQTDEELPPPKVDSHSEEVKVAEIVESIILDKPSVTPKVEDETLSNTISSKESKTKMSDSEIEYEGGIVRRRYRSPSPIREENYNEEDNYDEDLDEITDKNRETSMHVYLFLFVVVFGFLIYKSYWN